MATPRRADPKPQAPAKLTGDLNAPVVKISFGGMFPDLMGVGDSWTVEMTSRILAMFGKDTIPNVEIDALFGDAFAAANPDVPLKGYPARLMWQAVQQLYFFRVNQVEVTAEVIRNEPQKMQARRTG